MSWNEVGTWIKDNVGSGAALIGSLLTGNVPGAVAAGISMISSATGTDDPKRALVELQNEPEAMIKLKKIAAENEASIRKHIESMERMRLEDAQKKHEQTQQTIRSGDDIKDQYVRHTRPKMAKQSWIATIGYCIGCFGVHAIQGADLFDIALAGILSAPAWAYLGLRTGDKFASAWKERKT